MAQRVPQMPQQPQGSPQVVHVMGVVNQRFTQYHHHRDPVGEVDRLFTHSYYNRKPLRDISGPDRRENSPHTVNPVVETDVDQE